MRLTMNDDRIVRLENQLRDEEPWPAQSYDR
jgi:hypothetical protein